MNEPVRVLSDLHLGHKISRIADVSALLPMIAGAGTVIFNGDTWQALAAPFYQRSLAMLEELKSVCREEGVNAVFLSGNHDPDFEGPGWVELAGGRIIVTHGDALLPDGSPWKREILTGGARVSEIWSRHPDAEENIRARIEVAREIARELCSVEYPTGRDIVRRAVDAIVPPMRAVKMVEAWLTQGRDGAAFCDRYFPRTEFLLIGHFHLVGSWFRDGRRIINTGSFMAPGRAHWVEWENGWLSRGIIDESAGICRKGKTLDVWRLGQEEKNGTRGRDRTADQSGVSGPLYR